MGFPKKACDLQSTTAICAATQVGLKAELIEGKAVLTSPLDAWLPANEGLIHMSLGLDAPPWKVADDQSEDEATTKDPWTDASSGAQRRKREMDCVGQFLPMCTCENKGCGFFKIDLLSFAVKEPVNTTAGQAANVTSYIATAAGTAEAHENETVPGAVDFEATHLWSLSVNVCCCCTKGSWVVGYTHSMRQPLPQFQVGEGSSQAWATFA